MARKAATTTTVENAAPETNLRSEIAVLKQQYIELKLKIFTQVEKDTSKLSKLRKQIARLITQANQQK